MSVSAIPGSAMRVGRYEVLRKIAVGEMAELVLARLVGIADFRKLVVLKWIRSDLAELERVQALFAREARIAARLDHPNIVHTVDFGLAQGRQFVAMEYVHGESLASLLARTGTLPLDGAVRLIAELLGALDYAHTRADDDGSSLGIVHRDVCPTTVVVGYEGHVVLVDFAIARAAAWEDLTYTGEVRGKIDYAAPEQARGDALDGRADVYSAGVLLSRLVDAHGRSAVASIVERATAADRTQRFATAAAMRDALLALARERGLDMSPAPLAHLMRDAFGVRPHPSAAPESWFAGLQAAARMPAAAPAPVRRSSRRVVLAAGLTVALALAVALVMIIRRDPAPTDDDAPAARADAPPPFAATTDAIPTTATPAPTTSGNAAIAEPTAPPGTARPTAREAKPAPRTRTRRTTTRRTPRDPDDLLPTREVR
jgi:tRNA A-37 threonylcarbamoyl transferase component Bud32